MWTVAWSAFAPNPNHALEQEKTGEWDMRLHAAGRRGYTTAIIMAFISVAAISCLLYLWYLKSPPGPQKTIIVLCAKERLAAR
jgi:hypothetical protein